MTRVYPLFGGAITVDLPEGLTDASDLRQIPDTQEVFLTPDSDVTFIVEILQQVDSEDLREAVKFHFDSLAHDNSAQSSTVESVIPPSIDSPSSPGHPAPSLLSGTQIVRKFNRTASDTVRIFVALFRISEKKSDVVLSCNVPISSSNPETKVVSGNDLQAVTAAFEHAVASFKILDYSLFA